MNLIPREESRDSTLALLSEGYTFISRRCQRLGSDAFETRLMFRKVICTMGEESARMFYHPERFTRKGAVPLTTLKLLQDKGSVQTMDGPRHHHRKQLFMSVLSPSNIDRLVRLMTEQWYHSLREWVTMDSIVLHDEVQGILCRAACEWAGIALSEKDAEKRTREFAAMIDGSGAIGPRNWIALLLRTRSEKWARKVVDDVRAGRLRPPPDSPLQATSRYKYLEGRVLNTKIAAVELTNFLRPIVAVARYVTFAALALHYRPEFRERLVSGEEDFAELFVQEVRRFFPFFPMIAGRVWQEFEWRDHCFERDSWVILDLYGTNHDPRSWTQPEVFQPERFREWNGSAYNFIPQGGGGHALGHRCPGELLTIELIKSAVYLLTGVMQYQVPPQDLRIDLSRVPALPQSGFIMSGIRQ